MAIAVLLGRVCASGRMEVSGRVIELVVSYRNSRVSKWDGDNEWIEDLPYAEGVE